MHILRALVGFLGLASWFPNFADLSATTAQNPKTSANDFASTFSGIGADGSSNWSGGVLFPEERKIFIIPNLSQVDTTHGNRGLIYNIDTDTYTQSSVVFPNPPQFSNQRWVGVLLKNGKALIAQSYNGQLSSSPYYLYDIKTDSAQTTSSTSILWINMLKLPNDQVYMLGYNQSTYSWIAQIYDSDTNTFISKATPPNFGQISSGGTRTLVMLPNGNLLIVNTYTGLPSYLYNPNNDTYTVTNIAAGTGVCLLDDGRIFFVRGLPQVAGPSLDYNGYIWDPTTGTTQTIPNVNPGYFQVAVSCLLPDGRVLIGFRGAGDFSNRPARIFNPSTLVTTSVPGGNLWNNGASGLRDVLILPNGKAIVILSSRLYNNKFQLISGDFTNGIQFPLRQFQGSYLNGGKCQTV